MVKFILDWRVRKRVKARKTDEVLALQTEPDKC